jgi:hypothetical protein
MVECSKCNQLNCKGCIDNWILEQQNCPNPNCNIDFSPSGKPNLFVVNMLKDSQFNCTTCKAVFKYTDHEKHMK